jgi:Rad3-related DNA helicase
MLKKTGLKSRLSEFSKLSNQYDILKSHVNKIEMFLRIYNRDNWVMEAVPRFGRSLRKFSFRPIDVSYYANKYLFRLGKTVLLMSATILDKETFCKSLGIDESDASFISIPTPFPKENRPILFVPAGSMASKSIGNTLPHLRNSVNEILNFHKNEKGIIHCHTYRIAKYLKDNIKSDRLMLHDATNRDETLKKHAGSSKPVVLLSPSMAEGVDLKDDLSRFQVICKIPYPYLGDPLVKKRMNKWKKWYPMQTAKLIVQSAGRSIRSDSDSAVTYILDADWKRFYYSNKGLFPKTFIDSLKG